MDGGCDTLAAYVFYVYRPPVCNVERGSMLFCYQFSGSALDAGPAGHNGTLIGTLDFQSGIDGAPSSSYRIAPGDVSSYMFIPDSAITGLGDFTLAFWARIENTGGQRHNFVNVSNTTSTSGEVLGMTYQSDLGRLKADLDPVLERITFNTTTPADQAWHHYAYSRENTILRLYFDGAFVAEVDAVATVLTSGPGNGAVLGQEADSCCAAGTFDGTQNMAGTIDNLVLYNQALGAYTIRSALHFAR